MPNENYLIDESQIDPEKLLPIEKPRFSSPPMPPPPVPEIPVTVAFGSQMPPTIKQTPPFGPAVPTIPLMKIAPAGSANTNAVAAPAQNKANSAHTLATKALQPANSGRVLNSALTGNKIDPSKPGVLARGSTPATMNSGLAYTSDTSSINLVWEALALYRADGTITGVGTGSQDITGLGSGRTFFVFPYWHEETSSFGFVDNSSVSFPNLTGIAYTKSGNEYATTTTSAALPSVFSLSLWVQVASGYAGAGGLTINTSHTTLPLSSTNSVLDFEWSSGQITVNYRDSGGTLHTLSSPQTYNDGEFHHVCYVCDPANSSQILYVDGVSVATGTSSVAVSSTAGYFWLNRGSSNITMTGTLTEVAFFDVALTAVDVGAIFNAGNAMSQGALETTISSLSPTIWWKSTDSGPTTIADSGSIGGNTGTAANSPTFKTAAPVFGAVGSPAIAWPSRSLLVTQVQNEQGNVPFTVGGWAVATTATGTGGGSNGGSSGGSGTGCFSGNTRVQTPNGNTPIERLQSDDLIISKDGQIRRIAHVFRHGAEARDVVDMGDGELATTNHLIADGDEWISAGERFRQSFQFHGEVFNLAIEGEDFDSHSFMLANGVLAHNSKIV